jgi:hypothetical protein
MAVGIVRTGSSACTPSIAVDEKVSASRYPRCTASALVSIQRPSGSR